MTNLLQRLHHYRGILWGLALTAVIGFGWLQYFPSSSTDNGLSDVHVDLGRGDYHLTTTQGTAFTQETLIGKPSLVFFGFTHCPDICPTTLGDIAGWKEDLGPIGGDLRIFFVTVDPDRDTLDMLRPYVEWLPDAVGVTGSIEETSKVVESFRVYARKVPLDEGSYSMDHSAYVMVFDRDGVFNQIFGYQEDPERVVAKLHDFLEDAP